MKTVKEYANSVGKSHQSVYKQLNSKKNKERLESHVWKQDGTTYLDDVAIDILNESRQMIQIQNDIQAHEDNDNLRKEVNDLKNKIINLQDELKVKTEQMTSLLLENKEKTFLLEQKKDQTKEINQLKAQGINKIILQTHVGYELDKKLATSLSGVDVIIGGSLRFVILERGGG